MAEVLGKLVEVDLTKAHHWIVTELPKNKAVRVTCLDCDYTSNYPIATVPALRLFVEKHGDLQLISWDDGNGD